MAPRTPARTYFKRFEIAYDEVTRGLKVEYVVKLPEHRQIWFDQLIDGFRAEYQKWHSDPQLEDLWKLCDQEADITQLALCAFLHMTYDLARVIASTLIGKSPDEWFPVYHDADYTILRAFGRSFRRPELANSWTPIEKATRPFVGNLLMRAFSFHILMLRELAWRWGTKLAAAQTPSQREKLEARLLSIFVETTRQALTQAYWAPNKIDLMGEAVHHQLRTTDKKEARERLPLFIA